MNADQKCKLLTNDLAGRFVKGEVGILLENNFDKYDYFVDLGKTKEGYQRLIYFYKDEVELL